MQQPNSGGEWDEFRGDRRVGAQVARNAALVVQQVRGTERAVHGIDRASALSRDMALASGRVTREVRRLVSAPA